METLFSNIKGLVQARENAPSYLAGEEMKQLPCMENAYLLLENGKIKSYGPMAECPVMADEIIDVQGRYILPSWVDSHSHIVYAGNRENEFAQRIAGMSYEEIAQQGGGIVNSAARLADCPEEELYLQSKSRLDAVMRMGTGAIEIKSGYGLSVEAELKMLRVIRSLGKAAGIPVKATFLGAHAIPKSHKGQEDKYVDMLIDKMLPQVAEQQLADYIDIFCEKGYFSLEQSERILQAAEGYGLLPKLHVNQFNSMGAVALGVKYKALSLDHLEVLTESDLAALQSSKAMPVALPSCSFFIGIPYTPARQIIDAGLPLALASDYNPGSSPSGNMNFVLSCACIHLKMSPEEAINAATLNAAYAMGLEDEMGTISRGKRANLILTEKLPSYTYLPYSFGQDHIAEVYVDGKPLLCREKLS